METNVYTFDDAGRLVGQTVNGQSRTYGYDFQSRMTSLTDTNGLVFSYAFDGEGNRVRQSLNDCLTTRFVYDGGNVVMELNGSNEVVWAYVNGAGMDQPVERIAFINGTARNRQVYHFDGLGSVSVLTDESGEPVQTYTYAAFGGVRAQTGTDLNRVTFTAREALGDSLGFYYYRNRVYDPNTGRFTSEDPLGFVDGANRYVYVGNNSIIAIDRFGLCSDGEGIGFWDWLQGGLDVGGTIEPTPFCDLINAAISGVRGNKSDALLSLAGVIPYIGDLGKVGKYGGKALKYADEAAAAAKQVGRNSDDAAALVDLAKQAKRTGVSPADAETLLKWADEVNLPRNGPEIHPNRKFNKEHIRIGPVNHITINP